MNACAPKQKKLELNDRIVSPCETWAPFSRGFIIKKEFRWMVFGCCALFPFFVIRSISSTIKEGGEINPFSGFQKLYASILWLLICCFSFNENEQVGRVSLPALAPRTTNSPFTYFRFLQLIRLLRESETCEFYFFACMTRLGLIYKMSGRLHGRTAVSVLLYYALYAFQFGFPIQFFLVYVYSGYRPAMGGSAAAVERDGGCWICI